MSQHVIAIVMESQTCIECGVLFAITHEHEAALIESGDPFHCPNGHEQHFHKAKGPSRDEPAPKDVEARRQLVRALHDAEQAEAKAAEAKNGTPDTDRIRVPAALVEMLVKAGAIEPPPVANAPNIPPDTDRLAHCKLCGKGYWISKGRAWLGNHYRNVHKVDPVTLQPLNTGKGAANG